LKLLLYNSCYGEKAKNGSQDPKTTKRCHFEDDQTGQK